MSRGADEFADYVLSRLPAPPARVLEVGCGDEGGVTPALAAAGYDVVAIDPRAPEGPPYRRVSLEEFDDDGRFDACVAGRVLHHLEPLGAALDRLAALAPVLVVDDFAHDRIDQRTRDWYRREFEQLAAAGTPPKAPRSLEEWRAAHPGLHSHAVMKEALDARYDAIDLRWEPYLYRWLTAPETKAREEALIDDGALQAIGFRYTGRVRS
jgi:hypothetical protein